MIRFRDFLKENSLNNKSARDIYDFEFDETAKQFKKTNLWIKSKKSDITYFLRENDETIVGIEAIKDKSVLFINSAFSKGRGKYIETLDLILKTPIKEIVSDVILSEDATKFWTKIIYDNSRTKTFRNYKDEVVLEFNSPTDEALHMFQSQEYRIGLKS